MTLATGSEELLVPGREGKALEKAPAKADLLLLEFAREGGICSSANWPKTSPVAAAAAAVPAPMSCLYIRNPQSTTHNVYKAENGRLGHDVLGEYWPAMCSAQVQAFLRVGFRPGPPPRGGGSRDRETLTLGTVCILS